LPRQQVVTAERWSQTESTTAAEVMRQRRELFRSDPAVKAVWLIVPTLVSAIPCAECQRQSKSEPKGSAKCCHFGVGEIAG
jgi:hypothetical protein